jgi:epoxyqueuosine reductase
MPEHLTRREFFKEMGLLATAVAAGPMLADWDEKLPTQTNRPSWIKHVDKPTVEIDWSQIERWDGGNTAFNPKYYGDKLKDLQALQKANSLKFLKANRPGWTLKDLAVAAGWGHGFSNLSTAESQFIGPETTTPEQRGVAKWTGAPEEAAKIVTAAMRYYGAASVGFVELDPNTTEKLIYAKDSDGKTLEWSSDVDVSTETEDKRLIPAKARYVIVYTVQMSHELWRRAPSPLGASVPSMGYEMGGLIQARTQMFLKALGYNAPGEYSRNALGIAPGLAVMAGLGEMARYNRLITPEYGPNVRVFKLLTDLPVAPTKPIDAGLMEFCKHCKKCADMCPSGAISTDTEPTWKVKGGWNRPGIKTWYDDAVKCRTYWYECTTGCGVCFANCPFASQGLAAYHQARSWLAANMPWLGSIQAVSSAARAMDDYLYAGKGIGEPQKDPEEWYNLDLPEYGVDTTRAKIDKVG